MALKSALPSDYLSVAPRQEFQFVVDSLEELNTCDRTNCSGKIVYIRETQDYVTVVEDSLEIFPLGLKGVPVTESTGTDPFIPYRLIEEVGNYIYVGEANAGTHTSSAGWRIKRIETLPDGDVTVVWAPGSSSFSLVWDNRTSYSFTIGA